MLSTQANQALPLFPLLIFSHFVAKSILIPLLIDCHQGQKAKDWTKWSWWARDQLVVSSSKRLQYYPTVFVLYFFSLLPLSLCFITISLDFHLNIVVSLSGVEPLHKSSCSCSDETETKSQFVLHLRVFYIPIAFWLLWLVFLRNQLTFTLKFLFRSKQRQKALVKGFLPIYYI